MNSDHVNKQNTPTWVKMNEDAQSHLWRKRFCEMHGGRFVNTDNIWNWNQEPEEKKKQEKYTYIFSDPKGTLVEVDNMMRFCREKSLNKSAIYEVISGKRNHHKNFRFVEKKITI